MNNIVNFVKDNKRIIATTTGLVLSIWGMIVTSIAGDMNREVAINKAVEEKMKNLNN